MLIVKYLRDGVECLDPSFYPSWNREEAESRAHQIGGWVEETQQTPSELLAIFGRSLGEGETQEREGERAEPMRTTTYARDDRC
jgi:hypothetical protein